MSDIVIFDEEPYSILKDLKLKNVNRIVCAQLNINSIRNKFDQLRSMIAGIIDILVITETKLNYTFPQGQFIIEEYSKPYRLDRSHKGGGIMIFHHGKFWHQNSLMILKAFY